MQYDICIIGSGAGAGPIAYELSLDGKNVVVVEKGENLERKDFSKDEIAYCRRDVVTPNLDDEYHILEEKKDEKLESDTSKNLNWSFWNGNIVGGASNFMSGFFHKLTSTDFKLYSTYGMIEGANIVDWPISFEEFSPYYEKVKNIVGVSDTTKEHPMSEFLDIKSAEFGIDLQRVSRAILSDDKGDRKGCYYSNYCGSYGCSSGAKGSSREALLDRVKETRNVTILSNTHVKKLINSGKIVTKAVVYNKNTNKEEEIEAKVFVVACGAIESSRLLLNSISNEYPNGLANSNKLVGKNLIFSAGGIVTCDIDETILEKRKLFTEGFFINRALKEWYEIDHKKGGIVELMFEHPNPIRKAIGQKWGDDGNLVWGEELYKKFHTKFLELKQLNCEIFLDWLPHDDCFVSTDPKFTDKYGMPVAKIRINSHPYNQLLGEKIAQKTKEFLEFFGGKNIQINLSPYPPQNLQAGGCRFGNDPKTSVLDKNCKAWDVENLYVTDGSFIPTGGSVPYTYTIYANSFRVAEAIKQDKAFFI